MNKISEATEKINSIIEKCWENEKYKKEFISDPASKLFETANNTKTKLVVFDQTDDDVIFFNIPAERTIDDISLSDDQLDMINGGWAWLGLAAMTPLGAAALGISAVIAIVIIANEL